jgi:ferrochelatase
MLLENLLAVTGGKLLNSPSISRFDSIEFTASKVVRGSLFITEDPKEIEVALKNGAYGILTDNLYIDVTDEESAWIYVKDIKKSLIKLLRLWLLKLPREIYYVSKQVLEFLNSLQSNPSILLLNGDEAQKSKQILQSSQNQIIFCDDKLFLEHIGTDIREPKIEPIEYKVVDYRVFETSIIINEVYYNRLPLIPSMVPFLIDAIGILKSLDVTFSINNINFTPSLEPVFVNSSCERVGFGESDKVLIFADSNLKCEHLKIFENIKWIEFKLLLPSQIKFSCDIKIPQSICNSQKELFDIVIKQIKKRSYTLIFAQNSNIFFKEIEKFNLNNKPILNQGLF